jgi:UDP-GlcNAc:undecaprenyl-phosphate GlcNAc-1-phosphate transferase
LVKVTIGQYLVLGIASFVIVGVLTPFARRFAISHGIYDLPNSSHKSHQAPVPYLGGVAIVAGTLFVAYLALFAKEFSAKNLGLESSVLAPALLLALVGLWDDIKNLSPLPRLFMQSTLGIFTSIFLIETHTVGVPTGHPWIDGLITLIWIVGICNSINFFDNVDGGAAGTVAISSLALVYLGYNGGQYFVAALSAVVAGSTVGFLLWNKSPARIYMGDAGALFLGVLIATLTIRFHPHADTKWTSFSTKILLLGVPILDTCVAVSSRILRKSSPFQGGRDHLSHRLIRAGLSRKAAVFVLWGMTAAFALCAMVIPSLSRLAEERVVIYAGSVWFALFCIFLSTPDS